MCEDQSKWLQKTMTRKEVWVLCGAFFGGYRMDGWWWESNVREM